MEGYTQSEYHIFNDDEEDEDEIELKKKVKYTLLLTEDEFDEED